jgi:ankyrin repeat protein
MKSEILNSKAHTPTQVRELVAVPNIDLNAPNKDGNTPLHVACAEGALEVVQVP